MKRSSKTRKKSPLRNQATADLLEALGELQSYAKRGMTLDDIKHELQGHQSERVRIAFHPPAPTQYPPAAVKKLRDAMAMSQATFAQTIGVSRILVQSWERGVRKPSPLACRLLDTIRADPAGWLTRLNASAPSPSRRAG